MPELKLQQSRLDGRYDIVECLGRGSYAEIYVARDNAASDDAPETVVIKALNMSLNETPDAELEHTLVTNFQNEALALDRVRHQNIISRLGHGTAIDLVGTTFHYIVLEYLPGGDMALLSRSRPLTIEKTLHYLEQVCSGLAHAHACGVIHRDIKPQNLLLTADRKIVKIADFGVARLEATEGAITRVGTNIYSAPEHNPLVQTGSLDLGEIASGHITPAADIYSLAKTTYALLAGESPRRFAQHAITELPEPIRTHHWSRPVLRVLERATQIRPDRRYQKVEEFWDDFAEAALPPTRPLQAVAAVVGQTEPLTDRRPSADLAVEPEHVSEAPPMPSFESLTTRVAQFPPADQPPREFVEPERGNRPKIVVPVNEARVLERSRPARSPKGAVAILPHKPVEKAKWTRRAPRIPHRMRPLIVALILIVAFTGMLLATHKYVTSRWNPFAGVTRLSDVFIIGREGVTTTDVNLRPDASSTNQAVGLAEFGSRVKVLSATDNWYEVQVLEHGRPKKDPFTSDKGWVNKRFVRFD